jgi:isoleucyl-tRNA synthetase
VLNALETARAEKTIGSALEARVSIYPRSSLQPQIKSELLTLLNNYKDQLRALLIVSQVEVTPELSSAPGSITESSPGGRLAIGVERAHGKKCERCWNYSTHVGESAVHPTFCERCLAAIAEIEQDAGKPAGSAAS